MNRSKLHLERLERLGLSLTLASLIASMGVPAAAIAQPVITRQTLSLASLAQSHAWAQARLARSLNLQALYPETACPVYDTASAISPDGALIAVSSYAYERSCPTAGESTLTLWSTQTGELITTLQRGPALEAFSQGDPSQGEPSQEPETEGHRIVGEVANTVAFTSDGQQVVAGMSDGTIRFWSTEQGNSTGTVGSHRYAVRAIALSPDGRTLVSAGADQTLRVWDLPSRQLRNVFTLNVSDGIIHTLLFSPDGQRLATATNRNTLQLWDATNGQLIRTFVDEAINSSERLPIRFSTDGQRVATGDVDHSVKLWNARTGSRIITLKGHTNGVKHLAFSPDGRYLASAATTTAHLWNLQTYHRERAFALLPNPAPPSPINNLAGVAFSPDGQSLAIGSLLEPMTTDDPFPQQGITLWQTETGQQLDQIRDVAEFQFSPNGRFLMANGLDVQLWEPN